MIRAVTLIPGATEFGYEPATVLRVQGRGQPRAREPPHRRSAGPTGRASLDELQAICPQSASASALVVAWFGTDLRAGSCDGAARRRAATRPRSRRVVVAGHRSRGATPQSRWMPSDAGLRRHAVRRQRRARDPRT